MRRLVAVAVGLEGVVEAEHFDEMYENSEGLKLLERAP